MPRSIYLAALFAALALYGIEKGPRSASGSPRPAVGSPEFTKDGKLVRPAGYRKWVFLSSGYGMSYSEKENADHLMFTNVFVPPADYDYFVEHGNWPEKTMLVLELYGSQSKGSINKHGKFSDGVHGARC